jgi:hypothetical protein
MRAASALRLVLLAAAAGGLGGCLGSALGVVTAPVSTAAGAASGVGSKVINAGGGPISDLDRIIARNPEAANAEELRQLRESLANQGMGGPSGPPAAAPVDEFDRHARQPRRRTADRIELKPRAATGTREGPTQREEPTPFANARTSSIDPEVRRWYDVQIAPVRLGPAFDGRRGGREPDRR